MVSIYSNLPFNISTPLVVRIVQSGYIVTADGFRDVQTESCAHSKRKYSFAQDLQPGDSPHAKRVHRDGI